MASIETREITVMERSYCRIVIACAAVAGLLMFACGDDDEVGVDPSTAAQNLCDTALQCAEEDGLEVTDDDINACPGDVESAIESEARGLAGGVNDEDCQRSVAAIYDCMAGQTCDDLADWTGCEDEEDKAEEICEEAGDSGGGSGSGHPSAEAMCQWEVDCGWTPQDEYAECVDEGTYVFENAAQSCVTAMENWTTCVTAHECDGNYFENCEAEGNAVESECQ